MQLSMSGCVLRTVGMTGERIDCESLGTQPPVCSGGGWTALRLCSLTEE